MKHTKEIHGIFLLKRKHRLIKKIDKNLPAPSIHGHKHWDSSYLIMDYLNHYSPHNKAKIMEIGCGWGLLSTYCASRFNAKVTALDADENILPYLKIHAMLNDVKIKAKIKRFEEVSKSELKNQQLVLGSDICFWNELVNPLYQLISKSIKAGTRQVIIADPGRPPFLKLAKRCQKKFKTKVIDWETFYPKHVHGSLLIVK